MKRVIKSSIRYATKHEAENLETCMECGNTFDNNKIYERTCSVSGGGDKFRVICDKH